jgi:hypothetical protein
MASEMVNLIEISGKNLENILMYSYFLIAAVAARQVFGRLAARRAIVCLGKQGIMWRGREMGNPTRRVR